MKNIMFAILISIPVFVFAQRTGNLTVFSEDGDKFFLVLNGEKQNDKAQANIRVEELPQPYYSTKVIFEDSTIATISKNVQLVDAESKMMDVTYRVRKDKARKAKLNLYSAIEVTPDFVAPQGMYVRRFGHPGETGIISQTTTTSTSNTMDANINVPGVSMNITINDPDLTTSSTTTTTTSSHQSHSSSGSNHDDRSRDNNCRGWAMKQADFTAAKKTISDASFEGTRLSTAKSIAVANCLSTDQVIAICNLFSFEDSKLEFARYAYKYCIDPKNYFKVGNVFSFDSSKETLNKFLSGE